MTLSNNFPGQNSVTLTYKFSYNRQLGINDVIELKLPMWSSPVSVSTNSLCGDTTFALEEIGSDSDLDYGLRLTILDVSVPANKLCNINVPGMTNPNMLIPANADTIQHRVISMYGGMPFLRVDKTAAILEGVFSNDSFVVNDALPSQNGVEGTYTFMYDRDLDIGDTIELTLPGWGGSGLITSSKCGVLASTFSLNISTNVNNEFMIVLTILGQKLYRDSPCSIRIKGLTNPPLCHAG